ncbi:MAG: Ig-like protein, group 1 [Paraglaciecola sp.]|nr:Ig-like protein, group 1 [Paraglaciecola sp.]
MRIRTLFIVSFLVMVGFSGCGGVSGENGSDPFGSDDEVLTSTIKLGYFDQSGQFVEGVVGVTLAAENGLFEISAGGSVGLHVTLVDSDNQIITDAYLVKFTSNCVTAEQAILDTDISTVNGEASSTYTDDGCAGSSGTKDQVTATVVLTDDTLTATQEIDIRPEVIGAIGFASALPQSIVLQGSSDTSQSHSIVTFVVSNDQGAPLANQMVEFSLTTEIGGLALSSQTAVTDTDGQVFVEVIAGTVPTAVRVNASVSSVSGEVLNTQSEAISVTTGVPDQRSFTLSSEILNIEGFDVSETTTNIKARLSDTFGNPVPDNTVVTFTAEGGQIESNCLTIDGACSVVWTSAKPTMPDGRVTILATAIGHETLFDSNGNNVFDDADGGAIVELEQDSTANGFGTSSFTETGFVDYSEAWRDDNEDRVWNSGEKFLDYNDNEQFDQQDGLFNGKQCLDSVLCGTGDASTMHVRKAFRLLVSGSFAVVEILDAAGGLLAATTEIIPAPDTLLIARGQKVALSAIVGDFFGNVMPADTNFSVSTDKGRVTLTSGDTVANSNALGRTKFTFDIENTLVVSDSSADATIQILIVTPLGKESRISFEVTLQ